jgi:hypothetical protein
VEPEAQRQHILAMKRLLTLKGPEGSVVGA